MTTKLLAALFGTAAAATMWLIAAPAAHASCQGLTGAAAAACGRNCGALAAQAAIAGNPNPGAVAQECIGGPVSGAPADYPDCDGLIPTQHAICVERHMSGQ